MLVGEREVDALVNNAAVFHHPPGLTVDNLEVTYHTNFLGKSIFFVMRAHTVELAFVILTLNFHRRYHYSCHKGTFLYLN